jgi:ABC-type transporter Mla MlaB component
VTDSGEAPDEIVVVDVSGLTSVDLAAVDALARLELAARRHGSRVRLRGAGSELQDLLALTGLSAVVQCDELPTDPRR